MPDPAAAPPQTQQPAVTPAPATPAAPAGVDLASIRAQLAAELRPTLQAELDNAHKAATAKEIGALQARHAEDLALSDAGVRDNLGRAAIRAAWDATPKAERGEGGPADWWGRSIAAHKAHAADPKAPKPSIHPTLTAYLPAVEAPAQPSQPARGARGPSPVDKGAASRGAAELPDFLPGESIADYGRRVDAGRAKFTH